jgi:GNAT superfamily N-acetyltransferase
VAHIVCTAFDLAIFTGYWQLNGCYVDPRWQRRGAGTLALIWGIQQAQAEWVPVAMKASPKGFALYEKSGFQRLRREEFDAFFDTGGDGYWKMVWEPEGVGGKERWVERAREKIKAEDKAC